MPRLGGKFDRVETPNLLLKEGANTFFYIRNRTDLNFQSLILAELRIQASTTAISRIASGRLKVRGDIDINLDGPLVNMDSGAVFAGVGTGVNGFIVKNPKNAAASGLSGAQRDIEVDIGGVPYYFTVYITKA